MQIRFIPFSHLALTAIEDMFSTEISITPASSSPRLIIGSGGRHQYKYNRHLNLL